MESKITGVKQVICTDIGVWSCNIINEEKDITDKQFLKINLHPRTTTIQYDERSAQVVSLMNNGTCYLGKFDMRCE